MQLFGIWDVFTYSYKSNSHACTMYCISSTVVHVNGGGGVFFPIICLNPSLAITSMYTVKQNEVTLKFG